MKNLNFKWKIMIWHTAALVLLYLLTFPIMYFVITDHLYSGMESLIQSKAQQVSKALRLGFGFDEPNSDIDLIQMDTYISVYSNDNIMISGVLPQNFEPKTSPNFDNVYYIKTGGHKWIGLDQQIITYGRVTGWFRVVKSLDQIDKELSYFRIVILTIIVIYIFFSTLSMLGGGIMKHALSPVKQITKTAQQISQGDLSQRINISGNDEVSKLASSFNDMVDCLEDTFNREKQFSSDVSHELRSPVAAIMVCAEEALNDGKTEEEYRDSLQTILKESKKMNSLISQLLIMSRSNNGTYKHLMESIDISSLTKTVADELSEKYKESDIKITSEIEDGIVMSVEETLFMRMLINLVDNAVKYNVSGGWVKISLYRKNGKVILSVEDNGIGISKEDLPRIWDRFFKANPTSSNSSPGLGLSIVKWIAELHNGIASVKSELGKGSTFEIRFQPK